MELIKCPQCGRPFYNNNDRCPYCSQDGRAAVQQPMREGLHDESVQGRVPPAADSTVTTEHDAVSITEREKPTISRRAETIALVSIQEPVCAVSDIQEEPNAIETEPVPRKRHMWRWAVFFLTVLLLAAFVVLERDFIIERVSSLLH